MFENITTEKKFIKVELPLSVARIIVQVARFLRETQQTQIVIQNTKGGGRMLSHFPKKMAERAPLQKEWYAKFGERYPNYQKLDDEHWATGIETPAYSTYMYIEINISETDLWKVIDCCISHLDKDSEYLAYLKNEEEMHRKRQETLYDSAW